jgi:hypothetical protein
MEHATQTAGRVVEGEGVKLCVEAGALDPSQVHKPQTTWDILSLNPLARLPIATEHLWWSQQVKFMIF